MLNQPLKVMEKMIARQADKTMTKVHDRQHGSRKNKSTESAISETTNYIEKHIEKMRMLLGSFPVSFPSQIRHLYSNRFCLPLFIFLRSLNF